MHTTTVLENVFPPLAWFVRLPRRACFSVDQHMQVGAANPEIGRDRWGCGFPFACPRCAGEGVYTVKVFLEMRVSRGSLYHAHGVDWGGEEGPSPCICQLQIGMSLPMKPWNSRLLGNLIIRYYTTGTLLFSYFWIRNIFHMQVPEPQFLGSSLTLKKYVSPIHLTHATYANSPPGIFHKESFSW